MYLLPFYVSCFFCFVSRFALAVLVLLFIYSNNLSKTCAHRHKDFPQAALQCSHFVCHRRKVCGRKECLFSLYYIVYVDSDTLSMYFVYFCITCFLKLCANIISVVLTLFFLSVLFGFRVSFLSFSCHIFLPI